MPEFISPYKAESANGHSLQNGADHTSTASSSSKPAALTGKTVLIDNYDSFTYNVVEVSHGERLEVEQRIRSHTETAS